MLNKDERINNIYESNLVANLKLLTNGEYIYIKNNSISDFLVQKYDIINKYGSNEYYFIDEITWTDNTIIRQLKSEQLQKNKLENIGAQTPNVSIYLYKIIHNTINGTYLWYSSLIFKKAESLKDFEWKLANNIDRNKILNKNNEKPPQLKLSPLERQPRRVIQNKPHILVSVFYDGTTSGTSSNYTSNTLITYFRNSNNHQLAKVLNTIHKETAIHPAICLQVFWDDIETLNNGILTLFKTKPTLTNNSKIAGTIITGQVVTMICDAAESLIIKNARKLNRNNVLQPPSSHPYASSKYGVSYKPILETSKTGKTIYI